MKIFSIIHAITWASCCAALSSVEVWKPLTVESAASVNQPHGEARTDKSYANDILTIAGTRYDRGISTHAPSELIFALGGKRHKFTALVGMDDKGGPTADSKAPAQSTTVVIQSNDQGGSDVKKLKEDIQRLQLELTGKQQELMELRSTLGK